MKNVTKEAKGFQEFRDEESIGYSSHFFLLIHPVDLRRFHFYATELYCLFLLDILIDSIRETKNVAFAIVFSGFSIIWTRLFISFCFHFTDFSRVINRSSLRGGLPRNRFLYSAILPSSTPACMVSLLMSAIINILPNFFSAFLSDCRISIKHE